MPAITLKEAFNAFDPLQPISLGEIETLFVERSHAPTQDIITALKITDKSLKILFVGHRGSGKSSELTFLASRLEQQYISIFVPLYNIFKSPSVSHVEVIFAMTLRLIQKATDSQVLPPGLVKEAWNELFKDAFLFLKRNLLGEDVIPTDPETTFTFKVNALVTEMEARIGTESSTRKKIKENFEDRVNEMLEKIKDITRLLEKDTGKRLLVIVEDLDKFDLQDTRNLFQEHARTLTAPLPSVIYTFPVAMRYSNEYPEIKKSFDNAYILPNIGLKHRDGSPDEPGMAQMRQIFTHRADEKLVAPEVIEKIIALSGGHVKTLIQLARQMILKAIVDEQSVAQMRHLNEAAAALRDDYASLLTPHQIKLLRKQHKDSGKDLVGVGREQQDLLSNGSMLEFCNTRGPWGDVNPLVVELLERQGS